MCKILIMILEERSPKIVSFAFHAKKKSKGNVQKASNSVCTSNVGGTPEPSSSAPSTTAPTKTP